MLIEHVYNRTKTMQASQGGALSMSCVDSPRGLFRMHLL